MIVQTQAVEDQFTSMAKQMGKWIDHVLGPSYKQYCGGESWTPAINLYEDEHSFHVVADLSGVISESIDLRMENNRLILSGERVTPRPASVSGVLQVHMMETDHGRFCRVLDLPPGTDSEQAPPAWYGKGLLWIRLPKKR